MTLPSIRLMPPRVRKVLHQEAAALQQSWQQRPEKDVEAAVKRLRTAGWKARGVVRSAAPLAGLLAACAEFGADVLVVGARGARGAERLLLGSVADGALDRSSVPVLVAR